MRIYRIGNKQPLASCPQGCNNLGNGYQHSCPAGFAGGTEI